MRYKLICVDIDGTLLDDQKKIPDQVKESLTKAVHLGMQVALVTGRAPAGADMIEEELGFSCIKACTAGTYILWKDQCIYDACLPSELISIVDQKFAQPHQVPLWIFRGRDWYVTGIDKYITYEMSLIPYKPKVIETPSLAQEWKQKQINPNKLLIAADPEVICQIQNEMRAAALPGIEVASSSESYLEIFPTGVTKGEAIAAICKKLNLSLEETIAFGDQELDIPMIEKAGLGIAMGNAIEEAKQAADDVTTTNNEAGIADALERYVFSEK